MTQQVKSEERGLPEAASAGASVAVRPLSDTDRQEALDFLSSGTVDTIYMSGLIRDNGIKSPANRGAFYGAFGEAGELRGVALIGHSLLFETRC